MSPGAGQDPPVLRTVAELRDRVRRLREAPHPVVLVPTMGDLHEGHLELIRCGAGMGPVVVSIFVNPTQFGPNEDFRNYPRDLEADRAKIAALELPVVIFAPAVEEIYDPAASTYVEVEGISEPLCGVHRPGHFRGVATVVSKLFAMATPDVAIFGEKDAQQCLVLRRMTRDLHLPIRLCFVPTMREADGLAMSSRNRYLDASERATATRLSQALAAAQALLESGERGRDAVEAAMREACAGIGLDYAEMRSLPDLEHRERADGRVLLAIAARVGRARLIDNRALAVGRSVRAVALLEAHREATIRAALEADGFALAREETA